MKNFIIFTLLLMFTLGYAREVCETVTLYKGCEMNRPTLWDCDGKMVTRICDPDTETCTGSCKDWGTRSVSTNECSSDDLFISTASSSSEYQFSLPGSYTVDALINYYEQGCPYELLFDLSAKSICTKHYLLFWCIEYQMVGTFSCRDVICADDFVYETKNCDRDITTQTNCYEEEEGSCNEEGWFCRDNKVTQCTETGGFYGVNDCNAEGKICKETSSTSAICEDQDNREELLNCTPDGSKRCNPSELRWVQTCENSQWSNSFQCLMGCNNTGTDNVATQCVTTNVEVGGCTNGNTFCHDTGSKAYYFLCVNTNFQLLYQCDTPRCDINASICYDGCSLFESKYYVENYSGYYCNEEGDWIYQGECAGIVNEYTNQCELPFKCDSGTVTCSQNWVTECVNEEWRYIEQCSFGCEQGACKIEGASLFDRLSYAGDFLVVILPTISIFMGMILVASTIGYFFRNVLKKAIIWIQGKEE